MTYVSQKTRGRFVRNLLPSPVEYYAKQGIKLKGSGQWKQTLCPFHKDTNPSMSINLFKGAFRCMACVAKGGDIVSFHQQLHRMNFIQTCKQLGAWVEDNS